MEDFNKLREEILNMRQEIIELRERVHALEADSGSTGVYVNGSPEYVQDYLRKKRERDSMMAQGGREE